MKKSFKILTVIISFFIISIAFISCQKIDAGKLSGDWKVTSLNRTFEYKNQKYETKFDGIKKEEIYSVKDTLIDDVMTTYFSTQTHTGDIITDFRKDGSYFYKENFQNDATGTTITIDTDGFWYFTGPNGKTGYGLDDLLAMQSVKLVNSTNGGLNYTTLYQGENTLTIFEIVTLTKKKVELKIYKEETINFVKYFTSMNIKYAPR